MTVFVVIEVGRPPGADAEDVEFGAAYGPFHGQTAAETFISAARAAGEQLEAEYTIAKKAWWKRRRELYGERGVLAGTEAYAPVYELEPDEEAHVGPRPTPPDLWDYEMLPLSESAHASSQDADELTVGIQAAEVERLKRLLVACVKQSYGDEDAIDMIVGNALSEAEYQRLWDLVTDLDVLALAYREDDER